MYTKQPSAVYIIRNAVNDKVYIGSAINPNRRWGQHKTDLRGSRHSNIHLQASWEKYGEAAFSFSILEEVVDLTQLTVREQHYFACFQATDPTKGYNICLDARSSLGVKRSDEFRQKLRTAALRRPKRIVSDSTRALISAIRLGVPKGPMSEDQKMKIRASAKGKLKSEDHKRKIQEALKGRVFSDSTKDKLRQAQSGKTLSAETKQKMSEAHKGKKRT